MNESPKTVEEALAMGYLAIGRIGKEVSADETTEKGIAEFTKGTKSFDVPYTATTKYGTPFNHQRVRVGRP